MYLAKNLKNLRKQKGLSQIDFSADIGLSRSTVANWETGERQPDIEMIIRLAEYFGVTLDELILQKMRLPISRYSENLRFLRKKHGMTQEKMAGLLGYKGKQGYNAIETGKSKATVDDLTKLSIFFGVTLDQLVKQDLSKGCEDDADD